LGLTVPRRALARSRSGATLSGLKRVKAPDRPTCYGACRRGDRRSSRIGRVQAPLHARPKPRCQSELAVWASGTLGIGLVLGPEPKPQSYAELVIERDPATRVLQAMKLLTLAGIEKHTEQRLHAVCTGVFFRADLERGDVWRETVDNLVRMQFVAEGSDE